MKEATGASNAVRWWPRGHRSRRLALWSILVGSTLAGGVALLVFGSNTNAPPQVFSDLPAVVPETPVKAPLSDAARGVAARFVQTAVARENLSEAWTLVGPNLRGGLTRKEWLTGNNPVVPYPIDKLEVAPYKIDYSYTDSALIEIALIPRKGSGIRSQVFFLTLVKVGTGASAHWVVDNWVPRGSVLVPR